MIQTQKSPEHQMLEGEFYETPFKFSYSSMNTLLTAPSAFYNDYVLKNKTEEFKKYLLEGTVIHYLVLENLDFDSKFLVSADNLPSENSLNVINAIFKEEYLPKEDDTLKLVDFEDEVDDMLTDIGLHQSTKDRTKRLAKIIDSRGDDYFNFLKRKEGRTIIDSATLDTCTRRADIIKADPTSRELLGMDLVSDGRQFAVYNELKLDMDLPELPFGLKGILDNMVIDVKKKLVRINDFKTTGKSVTDFEKSVEYWKYWLQAGVYKKLVKEYLKTVLTDDWTIEFRFIVFDKYNQLYPFLVSEGTMLQWEADTEEVLKVALYHYETRDYVLPYEFALGNVVL